MQGKLVSSSICSGQSKFELDDLTRQCDQVAAALQTSSTRTSPLGIEQRLVITLDVESIVSSESEYVPCAGKRESSCC